MALERTHAWPQGHWDWPIHLSHKHGLRCGDMIFVGGQVDLDASGVVQNPDDLAAQTRAVVRNIGAVLEAFGADLADLARLTAFYVSDGGVDEDAFLGSVGAGLPIGAQPTVTAVPVPALAYPGLMVEIEAVAMRGADGARLPREVCAPSRAWRLPPPFVHGVRCGEMIFVSGQTARNALGVVEQPDDVVGQSAVTMERIAEVLDAFGADFDDAVSFTCFYVGEGTREAWEAAARKRAEAFSEPGPAATALPVPALAPEGLMVKMELTAMLGADGGRLERTHAWPDGHWDWPIHLPYKHGLRCGNLIFVGGQVALDSEGGVLDPGDMAAQTRTTMDNIAKVLAEFGAGLDDAVKVNTFYAGGASADDLHVNLEIRSASFTEPGPVSTGVPLPYLAFADMTIEIAAVAMVG